MSVITDQLRRITEGHPVDEKLLVTAGAGTAQEAVTIRDRLAAEGTPWIGFREATVADLCLRVAADRLDGEGLRMLPSSVQLFIVQELVAEHLLSEPDGYFSELDSTASVLHSARRTLEDLRGAGVTAADIEPNVFVSPDKGRALQRLLSAYEARLAEDGWLDSSGLIRVALGVLADEGVRSAPVLCVLGDARLTALEAEVLDRWPARRRLLLGSPEETGVERPSDRAWVRLSGFEPAPTEERPHPAGLLMRRGEATAGEDNALDGDDSIMLALCVGAENEVREVFRKVADGALRLDQVEIVYTDGERYRDLIRSESETLGVRCTFAEGLPTRLTRPGQALRLFYDWILEDFDDRVLRRMLRSSLVDLRRAGEDFEGLLPTQAAALLREARIGSGRERYRTALERLTHRIRQRHDELEQEGRSTEAIGRRLGLLRGLERLVHPSRGLLWELVPPRGAIPVAEAARCSVAFLDRIAARHGELEPPAHESLIRRLREVAEEVTAQLPRSRAFCLLRDEINLHPISRSGPRPGRLHVSPLASGGLAGRELTAVVGLDEGSFPGAGLEDPFLLDRERRRLSTEIPLRARRATDQAYELARALGETARRILLTSSVMDISDDRELYPSSAFLHAFRIATGDHRASFAACQEALRPPASFVPRPGGSPLEETEAWLEERAGRDYTEAVRGAYPLLAQGHRAEEARRSPAFSEWDGRVPSAAGIEDPRSTAAVVSASRLETLVESPYRYFLRYVLGLEPVDELAYEPGQWLDPLQRGSLLHELFRLFMEELVRRGERPDARRHEGLLAGLFEGLLERWHDRIPPPSEGAFRREVREIRRTAETFLRDEAARADEAEGLGFEVRFGFGDASKGLGSPDPVQIPVGATGQISLRGSIDRVDRLSDGGYRVWDYKTGSPRSFDRADPFSGGRLQWLLYALALQEILDRRGAREEVLTSGYLFPGALGHGQRFEYRVDANRVARAERMLALHLDLVDAGLFPHPPKRDACTWCDFRIVCGDPEKCAQEIGSVLAGLDEEEGLAELRRWRDG